MLVLICHCLSLLIKADKRAGRFRRLRDKYALTQAGKAANRMTFAELGEDEFQVEAQAQRVVKQKGQVGIFW
jgi:hypothetical protein